MFSKYNVKELHNLCKFHDIKKHWKMKKMEMIKTLMIEGIDLFPTVKYIDLTTLSKTKLLELLKKEDFKITINKYLGIPESTSNKMDIEIPEAEILEVTVADKILKNTEDMLAKMNLILNGAEGH